MIKERAPFGMSVGAMLSGVIRVLKIRINNEAEMKLTVEQFGLLFAISQNKEEVIQKDVAEAMCKDKSSILRMIDLLEEKELVRRVTDRADRRKNQILVTKKGERAIAEHLRIGRELRNELLEGLTEEDIETFHKVVQHVRLKASKL